MVEEESFLKDSIGKKYFFKVDAGKNEVTYYNAKKILNVSESMITIIDKFGETITFRIKDIIFSKELKEGDIDET